MSDLFGRQIKKQTARAKERLLEGLGKAKATQDDVFDLHAANLTKQSKACDRLQRDLKAYCVQLKATVQAQKVLRETIRELYEPKWPDREHVCAITQSLDLQWDEFEKTVSDQLLGTVNAYMAQFADLKAKVAKRGRKLVDYDSARNTFNAAKASSKKGDDDPRVQKAAVDLQAAETMYKELNRELVDALPATYDSRITFFVDTLQTLFNAEGLNHGECAKYNKSLVTLLDNLGNAFDSLRVPRIDSCSSSPNLSERREIEDNSDKPVPSPRSSLSSVSVPSVKPEVVEEEKMKMNIYPMKILQKLAAAPPKNKSDEVLKTPEVSKKNTEKLDDISISSKEKSTNPFDESDEDDSVKNKNSNEVNSKGDAQSDTKTEELNDQLPSNHDRKVLYKVRATHRYTAEDTDELTFDAGEIIAVLESCEEDLLDDGWLLGVKQSDGIRGVFPANFTKTV